MKVPTILTYCAIALAAVSTAGWVTTQSQNTALKAQAKQHSDPLAAVRSDLDSFKEDYAKTPQPTVRRPGDRLDPNPLIDYEGFRDAVLSLEQFREKRRLTTEQWLALSKEPNTIILDSRSAAAFEEVHVKGAININFSDFSEPKLISAIPDKDTRILIYCNNNFENTWALVDPDRHTKPGKPVWTAEERESQAVMLMKMAPLALNIPTFVNLHGYGYTNVWELGPVIDLAEESPLPFEGTAIDKARERNLQASNR